MLGGPEPANFGNGRVEGSRWVFVLSIVGISPPLPRFDLTVKSRRRPCWRREKRWVTRKPLH